MATWLVAAVVSWLAGAGTAALVTWGRLLGARFVPVDYRRAGLQATAVHVLACATIYLAAVKLLQWRVSRGAMCAVTAVLSLIPLAATLAWRAGSLRAIRTAAAIPENWLFAIFFLPAGAAFGLLLHEQDPRVVALEQRLRAIEKLKI